MQWNDTACEYPKDRCVHHLFEQAACGSPEATAVVFEDAAITYEELNSRANQLAHRLIRLGVGPNVVVGLCLERSLEMIVTLIGILKAGGAYVPLDPALPSERLEWMLADSGARVLVSRQGLAPVAAPPMFRPC